MSGGETMYGDFHQLSHFPFDMISGHTNNITLLFTISSWNENEPSVLFLKCKEHEKKSKNYWEKATQKKVKVNRETELITFKDAAFWYI